MWRPSPTHQIVGTKGTACDPGKGIGQWEARAGQVCPLCVTPEASCLPVAAAEKGELFRPAHGLGLGALWLGL